VPPKQPIHSDRRTSTLVLPRPVMRREQDQPDFNRTAASVVEDSLPDPPPKIPTLTPDELAALRAFFELLSQWDESLKGELEHE
jgi:hypothetical protein